METYPFLLQYLLHIDTYLITFVANYGFWTYLVLFAIIFSETGLVIIPFLPGDSLLFAAGSISANTNKGLNVILLFLILTAASILGNKLNYLIGQIIGPRVFTAKKSLLLNKKHLQKAHQFYEKNGGKTIILARFIPIIRTFAPFVAGVSDMNITQFTVYNVTGAILWVGSLLGAGYFFGTLPFVRDHFTLVIYGIVAFSLLLPILLSFAAKIRYFVRI